MSLGILTKVSSLGTKVITKLPKPVAGAVGKVSLAVTANSPWILAVGGGILAIGAVVEASRKTPRFMEDLEEYSKMLEEQKLYKEKVESGEIVPDRPYTKSDYVQDRMSIYAKIVVAGIKRYGKAAVLLLGSFTCFGMALKILNGWFAGASAALAMTQDELAHLEENVEKTYGTEVLQKLKGPDVSESVVGCHEDENGETVVDSVSEVTNYNAFSEIFDESNRNWTKDPAKNRRFLAQVENYANDLLEARRYVFLNDVRNMLGFEPTDAGQVYGWTCKASDPLSVKRRISLGIFDLGSNIDEATKAFLDGIERNVWLEFNVDKKPIVGRCGFKPY